MKTSLGTRRRKTPQSRVTLSNNDLERISIARASGKTWRDIQGLSARFERVPLQSLWKMWKEGKVMPKYREKDTRPRIRIVAAVDAETKAAVRAAAEGLGVTEAEWIRRQVGMGLFTGALMAAAKVEARIAEKLREVLEVEGER